MRLDKPNASIYKTRFAESNGHGLRINGSGAAAQHAVSGRPPEGGGAAGVVCWNARLKAPRRRGRDQRGADGVIERLMRPPTPHALASLLSCPVPAAVAGKARPPTWASWRFHSVTELAVALLFLLSHLCFALFIAARLRVHTCATHSPTASVLRTVPRPRCVSAWPPRCCCGLSGCCCHCACCCCCCCCRRLHLCRCRCLRETACYRELWSCWQLNICCT
jgi:hypothetical protein